MSGSIRTERKWSAGIFATFMQTIQGLDISHSYLKSTELQYSSATIETRRFTPSPKFMEQVAKESAVTTYLKIAGLGAKAFLITGIKTATEIEIVTADGKEHETTGQIGVDVGAGQLSVGPKGAYCTSKTNSHSTIVKGPIVFPIQVEQLRLCRWKDRVVSREHTAGAMLGSRGTEKYIVERAVGNFEEEEMSDFGALIRQVVDEETGEECEEAFLDLHGQTEKRTEEPGS